MKKIREIVESYMSMFRYSGLYRDDCECGCRLYKDLFECGQCPGDCQLGYVNDCPTCGAESCDYQGAGWRVMDYQCWQPKGDAH